MFYVSRRSYTRILGYYDLLPEPEDNKNDMFDVAPGLTDMSIAFALLPIQLLGLSLLPFPNNLP